MIGGCLNVAYRINVTIRCGFKKSERFAEKLSKVPLGLGGKVCQK